MKNKLGISMVFLALLFAQTIYGQNNARSTQQKSDVMNTYVIERDIPEIGKMSPEQLRDVSKASCNAVKEVQPGIEWVHSYVTENKTFCVYRAQNEEMIRKHAEAGEFPITAIYKQSEVIGPQTAGQSRAK